MPFDSVQAVARLARLQNGIIAAIGVLVGAWWAGGDLLHAPVILAALASVGLATFANAYNDLCDVDIDRVAHPSRPLPSGILTVGAARAVAWTGGVLGVVLSALVSPWMGLAAIAIVAVMREYSLSIKRRGLPGNIVVAILASLPFVYGAWAADNPLAGVVLMLVAAPLHLARELAKDLEDAKGDAGVRRTLAIQSAKSAKRAMLASMLAFVVAIAAFSVPRPLVALALLPATALACFGAWRAFRDQRGGPTLFKSAMVLAMISLFTLDAAHIR